MGIAIGILLTITVIVVIAWPFFKPKGDPKRIRGRLSESARLRLAREEIYNQIRQLEADHAANLIQDDEYYPHLRELRISAAQLIRAAEGLPEELSVEDRLEMEIEAARRAQLEPGEDSGTENSKC